MAQDALRGGAATLLLALLLPMPGAAGLQAQEGGEPDRGVPELSGYVEHVEVSLVLVHATVLDRRGETVPDLGPGDFFLTEEGVPQEIAVFGSARNQPVKVAFLLDVSGSMAVRGKFQAAQGAIHRFVEALQPGDQVALMSFADGGVQVEQPFTEDHAGFFRRLDRLHAYGQTALKDALAYASGILADARSVRAALVMVTDGVDNASTMTTFESIQAARRVQVPIYAIGLTDLPGKMRVEQRPEEGGRSFLEILKEFGERTGGGLFPVFNEEEVDDAVERVRDRLRGQYLLGYKPQGVEAMGFYRRIEVSTGNGRHRVMAREGYYLRP